MAYRSGTLVRLACEAALAALLLLALGAPARAQERDVTDPERRAQLQRQGAGLRAGVWRVQDLDPPANGEAPTTSPSFEGYFQRGLDLHLAIESSIGLWRYQETVSRTGIISPVTEEVTGYIVPLLTSIRFFPITRPGQPLEPFVMAGVGFALGIESSESRGTGMQTGFGFQGGTGLEWRLSPAFGLSGRARYQWLRFGGNVGRFDTFKGFGFDVGLTYRFQFE